VVIQRPAIYTNSGNAVSGLTQAQVQAIFRDAFDTEPVVLTPAGEAVLGQDFGCSGELPGYGIGCGGFASEWNQISGALHISTDPCGPGRPRLAVSVADPKGRVAGPYRLMSAKNGGPLTGCPAKSSRKRGGQRAVRR
jgi:hypothetical protein